MQLDSQMYLFGVLILLVSFLLNLIVVLIVRKSIRNDKMSKMIVMQQSAFRTESASTLDRMRTTARECEEKVEVSTSQAADMVRQISESLKTLSDYQEDLSALQSVCAEYKLALEKLRIATDQAEARISAVQTEVRKVEAVNDRMDSFRLEAERSMNQLQDLKAEYVRLVAATQESLKSAADNQRTENEDMLSSFSSQMERTKEQFAQYVASERVEFNAFADDVMKRAEDQAIDIENRRTEVVSSIEESRTSLDSFRSELGNTLSAMKADLTMLSETTANEIESRKSLLADDVASLGSKIDGIIADRTAEIEKLIDNKKTEISSAITDADGTIKHSIDTFEEMFSGENEKIRAALDSLDKVRQETSQSVSDTIAEALRNIESARTSLDSARLSYIAASKDALFESFSEMLSGINERYERIRSEADDFTAAIAEKVGETRETITLLSQGEQERIQDAVERLQELDRKIKASEEQLTKLSETVTSTKEELFAVQQDRGRLDSEIEERNKTLEKLNDEMQKSKSTRISEEAALVKLRLQISNLEKQKKDAERKAAEEKVQEEPVPSAEIVEEEPVAPAVEEISAEEAEEEPVILQDEEPLPEEEPKKKKPEEMIEEFPDDIFTGNVEEVELDDEEE